MYLSAEILPDSSNRKTQPGHLHEGAAQLLALYLHIQRLFRLEFTRLKFPTLSPHTIVTLQVNFGAVEWHLYR